MSPARVASLRNSSKSCSASASICGRRSAVATLSVTMRCGREEASGTIGATPKAVAAKPARPSETEAASVFG